MANTYYWRAVRRLAKKHDISVSRARKLNWEKEANAERKRRSIAHISTPHHRRAVPLTPTSKVRDVVPARKRTSKPKPIRKRVEKIPTRRIDSELRLRDYDQIIPQDEEEFTEAEDFEQDWQDEWAPDWEELNDLDDLEGFLQDFEYEDSDKYKEPS